VSNLVSRLAAAALLALLAAAPATAGPSPMDGGPASSPLATPVLFSSLFSLTTDVSGIGVPDAELATVGPSANVVETDGDNLLIVDDGTDCPNAEYPTIQSAVTAADPGDRIKVCPGVYQEEVIVPAGKDGIDLFSEGHLQAVIKAPPAFVDPARSIVTIRGAQDVKLTHFTITGPGATLCGSITAGVTVFGGGSATIAHNHITEIRDLVFSGCQNGLAVIVGRTGQGETGRAEIAHNLIDRYQKGGIFVDNVGSYAHVHHNEILGVGTQPTIAPNGVQVSRGAGADVDHNEITGNSFAFPRAAGTGVLLFQHGPDLVTVGFNDIYGNDVGLYLFDGDSTLIEHNESHDNVYDGIYADPGSMGNRIEYNRMEGNTEHGCHDDSHGAGTAGTANFWIKDRGLTEFPAGICRH
jgi:nitrous oxidase accessory protein NosD